MPLWWLVIDQFKNWIDVEIWGDKLHVHNEQGYGEKREDKERFNKDNPNFIGLHFTDCFDEEKLSEILEPYTGVLEAFQFDKPTDKIIPTTHWSNTDELLEYCYQLLQMP